MSALSRNHVKRLDTYEPGKPIEEVARELGVADVEDIIKLASNENALGPSPKAVAAIRDAATGIHRYPDSGTFYLKEALAQHLGVDTRELLLGNGSNELIELLGHVYLQPGRRVVFSDQAFLVYRLVSAIFEASADVAPMKHFTHDLDAILDAITKDTRLVFISNPNNPTGTMVDEASLNVFMDKVPSHVLTCIDEAYVELLPPERQPDTLRFIREGRDVCVLRTFSKTYGLAGLRIGYGTAPPHIIDLLNRVRQPFNVSALAQAAALAALQDEGHVERTRALVRDGLDYLVNLFEGMGLSYVPSVTNFILLKVGEGRRVFEALQRERVIVRPMDAYGLPEYVRVTVGTREENELFADALRRVRQRGDS